MYVCTLCFLAWRCLGLRLRGVKAVKPRFFFSSSFMSHFRVFLPLSTCFTMYTRKEKEREGTSLRRRRSYLANQASILERERERESERGREKLKKQE